MSKYYATITLKVLVHASRNEDAYDVLETLAEKAQDECSSVVWVRHEPYDVEIIDSAVKITDVK